jgi:hypothetical protein
LRAVTALIAHGSEEPMSKRSRRRARVGEPGDPESASATSRPSPYGDWKWRTFPVFFAFAVGLLVASFVNGEPDNDVAAVLQIAAIIGVSYGLARLFVRNVIVAGRLRRARGGAVGAEASRDDGEWVDEIVYPQEQLGTPTTEKRTE